LFYYQFAKDILCVCVCVFVCVYEHINILIVGRVGSRHVLMNKVKNSFKNGWIKLANVYMVISY